MAEDVEAPDVLDADDKDEFPKTPKHRAVVNQDASCPRAEIRMTSAKSLDKRASNGLLASDVIARYGAIETGKLTKKETKKKGRVQIKNYRTYLKAIGMYQWGLPIFCFALGGQISSLVLNVWLSIWNDKSTESGAGGPSDTVFNVVVFCALGFTAVAMASGSAFAIAFGTIRELVLLHEKLLLSVVGAPISVFNSTPEGRLVNRFNSDMDQVHSILGPTLQSVLLATFGANSLECNCKLYHSERIEV